MLLLLLLIKENCNNKYIQYTQTNINIYNKISLITYLMCGGSPLRIARCFACIYFYMIPTTCTLYTQCTLAPHPPTTARAQLHILLCLHTAHIYKFIHTNRAHMNVLLQRVVALPSTYFSVYIYTSLQKYARCIS